MPRHRSSKMSSLSTQLTLGMFFLSLAAGWEENFTRYVWVGKAPLSDAQGFLKASSQISMNFDSESDPKSNPRS